MQRVEELRQSLQEERRLLALMSRQPNQERLHALVGSVNVREVLLRLLKADQQFQPPRHNLLTNSARANLDGHIVELVVQKPPSRDLRKGPLDDQRWSTM